MLEDDDKFPDLSIVSTDRLIREIFTRTDGAVVIRHEEDDGGNKLTLHTHGGLTLAIGLVARGYRAASGSSERITPITVLTFV